jgi:hypothetical protein
MKPIHAAILVTLFALLLATACNPSLTAPASPLPAATTNAPARSPIQLSPTELKYRLVAQFGRIFYCDPDVYPVARALPESEFDQRFARLQQNSEEYQAILKHLGFAGTAALSSGQKQQVYAESKMLNAISLQPIGEAYQFSLRVSDGGTRGSSIEGTIDRGGNIQVTKREPTFTICPICLAGDTRIDTPQGPVRVEDLRVGMSVWTSDRTGVRRAAVIVQTAKRSVPAGTLLVRVTLEDGRALTASASHPAMDGRVIGDLARGDILDGARVAAVERVPIAGDATYDVLPAGETGAYWANGILLRSTLAPWDEGR